MKKHLLIVIAALLATSANAQLKNLLNKENLKNLAEKVIGGESASDQNVVGTWIYDKCAIEFVSDDFLSKAGGAVAAAKLESELEQELAKLGISQGAIHFTFNEDKTFSAIAGKIPVKGNYLLNGDTMTQNILGGLISTTCEVKLTLGKLKLLYNADKLLTLLQALTGNVSSDKLELVKNILKQYEGCKIGLEMSKQK